MRFSNIRTDTTFIKHIKLTQSHTLKKDSIKAEMIGKLNNIESMALNGLENFIKFSYLDSYGELETYFNRTQLALIQVLDTNELESKSIISIRILVFSTPLKRIFENLYIKLDEKINKRINKNDFVISINEDKYIAISSGNRIKDTLFLDEAQKIQKKIEEQKRILQKETDSKEKTQKEILHLESKLQNLDSNIENIAFSLLSDKGILAIKGENKNANEIIYKATKLMPISDKKIQNITLIKIKEFDFKDNSISANMQEMLESGELDSKYLEKWDEYARIEGELLLEKARELGEIKVEKVESFKLITNASKDLREYLNNGDYICFMDDTPLYLENKDLSWKEYIQQYITAEKQKLQSSIPNNKIKTYTIKNVTSNSVELENDENIQLDSMDNKKFSLSIFGDFIALKRKYQARQRILQGKSANPILPMIFTKEITETLKNILKQQKKNTHIPLSDSIESKIFPINRPTQNQIEAIDIAINTPDIAIIQGPPGTGKTTVLNAIIERLNELSDKDISKKGSIFISGFQHSAVENLINRMSLNGLPVIKYGNKLNEIQDLRSYENIQKYAQELADGIEMKQDSKIMQEFKEMSVNYALSPTQNKAKKLLEKVINTTEPTLTEQRQKAGDLLDEINKTDFIKDKIKDLKLIYAIRENALSFSDDGVLRNEDLLRSEIASVLNENDKKILNLEHFSDELTKLKYNLLKELTPSTTFEKEKHKKDILDLATAVTDSLNNLSKKSKTNLILADFKNALLSNPFILKDMIEEYSVAFSATTGQSSRGDILKAKGIYENNTEKYEQYNYDNVIIDEAAMVSPLDLFLVLVLAKQRIILVGDHRQLPHRLNEDVLKELEKTTGSNADIESKILKDSMFAWLKQRAQELEKIDGVKRSITLNNQYRTHPLLGKLVSDIFYEKYGEGYSSPLSESNFMHSLKGIENCPAVWIDMPQSKGSESKDGTSRTRECEAKIIVTKLIDWLSDDSSKDLSYGIISFYSAQVKHIQDEIDSAKTNDTIKERLKKVKVGSVDSFQGMEFDIVFLSVVRSGVVNEKLKKPESLFGFLCSPNRLCVAMSRQKKCLIVVGDKAYFQTPLAKEYVEGLYKFAALCEKEGRII